ncbi:hypothetical protein Lesp02_46140 [Lentzea sp. NBRC 105346]|nr:hypothetical protein Lesp02_46140 [Lentzea sp. NBRC 105346]
MTDLKRRAPGRVDGRVVVEGALDVDGQVQERQRVSAQLSYEHYELALEAHRTSRPLMVTGRLRHTGGSPEIVTVTRVVIE